MPFKHFVKMLGGVPAATEGAYGSGSERWYERLDAPATVARREAIRKSAKAAGFELEGSWKIR